VTRPAAHTKPQFLYALHCICIPCYEFLLANHCQSLVSSGRSRTKRRGGPWATTPAGEKKTRKNASTGRIPLLRVVEHIRMLFVTIWYNLRVYEYTTTVASTA
jgi:hypothetical protein